MQELQLTDIGERISEITARYSSLKNELETMTGSINIKPKGLTFQLGLLTLETSARRRWRTKRREFEECERLLDQSRSQYRSVSFTRARDVIRRAPMPAEEKAEYLRAVRNPEQELRGGSEHAEGLIHARRNSDLVECKQMRLKLES